MGRHFWRWHQASAGRQEEEPRCDEAQSQVEQGKADESRKVTRPAWSSAAKLNGTLRGGDDRSGDRVTDATSLED